MKASDSPGSYPKMPSPQQQQQLTAASTPHPLQQQAQVLHPLKQQQQPQVLQPSRQQQQPLPHQQHFQQHAHHQQPSPHHQQPQQSQSKCHASQQPQQHHHHHHHQQQQQQHQRAQKEVHERHYEFLAHVGSGAYGQVFKARDPTRENVVVAIKQIRIRRSGRSHETGMPMAAIREISLLKQLEKREHPNIVQLLDVHHQDISDRDICLSLVFEFIDQDLNTYLERCPPPGLGPDRIRVALYFTVLECLPNLINICTTLLLLRPGSFSFPPASVPGSGVALHVPLSQARARSALVVVNLWRRRDSRLGLRNRQTTSSALKKVGFLLAPIEFDPIRHSNDFQTAACLPARPPLASGDKVQCS
ncbi:cyclin-dependent kinase [Plakobranchus ocellatus]|uniref:cyclin-dependent kinase n=1 Tax=Plakobranchus ocellatus TaxID=259542 RepID=A0AAV3ZMG1_9GAST|nr:cyclin-dependent kinase [Plakobranchus ocellatus]